MNKKLTLCMLGMSAILIGGCASQQQAQMDYIGSEQAKTVALKEAGYTTENVVFSDTILDKRNEIDYYKVIFSANGQKYEYDIDALTGVVIASQADIASDAVPATASVTPQAAPETTPTDPTAQTTQTTTPPVTTDESNSNTLNSTQAQAKNVTSTTILTEEEAKSKALAHANLSAEQVSFIKAKLERDDGKQVYDVEFYTNDYKEYDYEIDASTGAVLSYDYDVEGYSAPTNTGNSNSGNSITEEKAKEIALAQVPGAASEHMVQFETDYDDGRLAYEGKIIYDGREYEFEIDGYSGAIREWDSEPVGH